MVHGGHGRTRPAGEGAKIPAPFGYGLDGVPPVKWRTHWTRQDAASTNVLQWLWKMLAIYAREKLLLILVRLGSVRALIAVLIVIVVLVIVVAGIEAAHNGFALCDGLLGGGSGILGLA